MRLPPQIAPRLSARVELGQDALAAAVCAELGQDVLAVAVCAELGRDVLVVAVCVELGRVALVLSYPPILSQLSQQLRIAAGFFA